LRRSWLESAAPRTALRRSSPPADAIRHPSRWLAVRARDRRAASEAKCLFGYFSAVARHPAAHAIHVAARMARDVSGKGAFRHRWLPLLRIPGLGGISLDCKPQCQEGAWLRV